MFWKSTIVIPTLFGAFLASACSSEETGDSDLLATYRAHVAAAWSAVSDRMAARTGDAEYHAKTIEQLKAMAATRSEMGAQCSQIDGCPMDGGVASHGMEGHMGDHMSGHMGNAEMLNAGEMTNLEEGELAMGAELDQFRMHCLDESATQETCDAYRQKHLEKMAAMLEAHDEMCGRMMAEGEQGRSAMGSGGMMSSSDGMMGSGGMMLGSGGMMGTGDMIMDNGGTATSAAGMAAGAGGAMGTGRMMDGGGVPTS